MPLITLLDLPKHEILLTGQERGVPLLLELGVFGGSSGNTVSSLIATGIDA
jgi:hypothetical protein